MLFKPYRKAKIDEKRPIIGSIFPEKMKDLEKAVRTDQINLTAFLIHHTNNKLGRKKPG